jgi:hypothetical protein
LKDEEAIDWCKRISKLSLDKGNKLKEGHGSLPKGGLLVYVEKRKEGEGGGRKNLDSYVWKGAHGKCVCKD